MFTSSLSFILVHTQLGENIGATARVLSNFGLCNIEMVAPRDGWPNKKAYAMAANGEFILTNAKVFPSLEEAVSDKHVIFATSARSRDIKKVVLSPESAAHEIVQLLSQHSNQCNNQHNSKISIIFGRESSGLTNHELSLADYIITIPTSSINPSMNIAHSVAIIAYEISKIVTSQSTITFPSITNAWAVRKKQPASKHEIEILTQKIIYILDTQKFFRVPEKRRIMEDNIRTMLIQNKLDKTQLRIWHGIVNVLSKRAQTRGTGKV